MSVLTSKWHDVPEKFRGPRNFIASGTLSYHTLQVQLWGTTADNAVVESLTSCARFEGAVKTASDVSGHPESTLKLHVSVQNSSPRDQMKSVEHKNVYRYTSSRHQIQIRFPAVKTFGPATTGTQLCPEYELKLVFSTLRGRRGGASKLYRLQRAMLPTPFGRKAHIVIVHSVSA